MTSTEARGLVIVLGTVLLTAPDAALSAPDALSVRAEQAKGHSATFRLPLLRLGYIAPRAVRRARLEVGARSRRLRTARVRQGARRGRVRVRLTSGERRIARRRPARVLLVLRLAGPDARRLSRRRLYSGASPLNRPLPVDVQADPRSSTMVRSLVRAEAEKGFPLAVREFAVPTYYADASTPRHDVALRRAPPRWTDVYGTPSDFIGPPPGWATDPTPQWAPRTGPRRTASPRVMVDVPIPAGARPDPEIDAHMTVIDRSTGCEYDFYAAHRGRGGWQALWANSTRIQGTGIYPHGLSSKASGLAGLAGLVRPEELRAGRIDHALFMSFPHTSSGGPVWPATSSDGRTSSNEAIPEGARIQLDPGLDLDSLALLPYERTIARALQRYGMIVGDTGGALSLFAEHPHSYRANPYRGLLPDSPYAYLDAIPVDRFRVIGLPQQQRDLRLELHDAGCAELR